MIDVTVLCTYMGGQQSAQSTLTCHVHVIIIRNGAVGRMKLKTPVMGLLMENSVTSMGPLHTRGKAEHSG